MTRKTITVSPETFERLQEGKADDESWDDRLNRLVDGESTDGGDELELNALVDDIGAEVERRVERVFDNRLPRR